MWRALVIIGLMFTLIATVFLYLGSRETPWGIRTWKEKSDKEAAFKQTQQRNTTIGFTLLFLGFLCQLIGSIGKQ